MADRCGFKTGAPSGDGRRRRTRRRPARSPHARPRRHNSSPTTTTGRSSTQVPACSGVSARSHHAPVLSQPTLMSRHAPVLIHPAPAQSQRGPSMLRGSVPCHHASVLSPSFSAVPSCPAAVPSCSILAVPAKTLRFTLWTLVPACSGPQCRAIMPRCCPSNPSAVPSCPIMTQCRPVRPWSRPIVPIAARSQHAAGPQRVSAGRPVARGRLFQSSRPRHRHRRRRRCLVLDVLPPPSQSSVIVQCRLPAEHVAPSSLHRPSLDSGVA